MLNFTNILSYLTLSRLENHTFNTKSIKIIISYYKNISLNIQSKNIWFYNYPVNNNIFYTYHYYIFEFQTLFVDCLQCLRIILFEKRNLNNLHPILYRKIDTPFLKYLLEIMLIVLKKSIKFFLEIFF